MAQQRNEREEGIPKKRNDDKHDKWQEKELVLLIFSSSFPALFLSLLFNLLIVFRINRIAVIGMLSFIHK